MTRSCDGPGRRRQAVRRAVLVDRAAADDGEHLVAARLRDATAARARQADAVGEAGAVGAGAVGAAAPVGDSPRWRENSTKMPGLAHHARRRRPAPERTRPGAAPGRRGAARPATTSRPCRPSPPGPRARACRRPGRRRRWAACRSGGARARSSPGASRGRSRGHRRRRTRRSGCRAGSSGSMPASSSASQAHSSSSRCCGSIASASRGEIEKCSGVEVGGVVEEAAVADVARAGPGPSGSNRPSRSQPRSAGNSPIASRPAATRRHRSSARTHLARGSGSRSRRSRSARRVRRRRAARRRRPADRSLGGSRWRPAGRGRVVEDQGGGQAQPGGRRDAVAQLEAAGESKPELLEGPAGRRRRRRWPSTPAACADHVQHRVRGDRSRTAAIRPARVSPPAPPRTRLVGERGRLRSRAPPAGARARWIEPVALALEGVRGQAEPGAARPATPPPSRPSAPAHTPRRARQEARGPPSPRCSVGD